MLAQKLRQVALMQIFNGSEGKLHNVAIVFGFVEFTFVTKVGETS